MFTDLSVTEAAFMSDFKEEHGRAWAGETIIKQGEASKLVLTIYSGLAVRFRTLPTGKRQILNVVMPGDVIGIEAHQLGHSWFSVEAVTDVTFCIFDAGRWLELLAVPSLAGRVSWLQALDLKHIDDRLAAVGAGSARQSISHFILDLYERLERRRLLREQNFALPLTHQQLSDALGLTTVHVHRTLRSLRAEGVFTIENRRVRILDLSAMRELACKPQSPLEARPLL